MDVGLTVEENIDLTIADTAANTTSTTPTSLLPNDWRIFQGGAWKTVLSWLLTNGRSKYAAVENTTHWMVLTVRDSGAGMSEVRNWLFFLLHEHECDYISYSSQENQAKLFRGIIQFNPGKLQKGGGTGLGLFSECFIVITMTQKPAEKLILFYSAVNYAVSKKIVDLHGGLLTVYSSGEGQGSAFTLRLPLSSQITTLMSDDVDTSLVDIEATKMKATKEPDDEEMVQV